MEDHFDYIGKNQEILDKWRAKYPLKKQGKFAEDGIMNKGNAYLDPQMDNACFRAPSKDRIENIMWAKAPLRVLFLTKDENISSTGKVWDVRMETFHQKGTDVNKNFITENPFYRNQANILYGILHTRAENMMGFHEFSYKNALKFSDDIIFARINCKKEGGGKTITNEKLDKAIKQYLDDLKDQISNLDADIIICCGHQKEKNIILNALYDIYPDEFKYTGLGDGKGTGLHYNAKRIKLAIDAYHLSYLTGGEELRYYEVVGAYYEFLKQHPEFINSHRVKSNL